MSADRLIPESRRIAKDFSRASATYDRAATLQQQIVTHLMNDAPMPSSEASILDIGCGTGAIAREARARGMRGQVTQLDLSEAMCRAACSEAHTLCADARHLPFPARSFDFVYSAFCLQWVLELKKALAEMRRIIKPEGQLHLATLGPESLPELAMAFREARITPRRLFPPRLTDLVHLVAEAGFNVTQHHAEWFTERYPDPRAVLQNLHALGARDKSNLAPLTPKAMRRLLRVYPLREGQAEASYQALFLSARPA